MAINKIFRDHFSIENPMNQGITNMEFDVLARTYNNASNWRTIIDYAMAINMNFDENTVENIIDMIFKNNCANRIPASKAPLDNFFIMLRAKISELDDIVNRYTDIIVKKNLPDTMSKFYVLSVLEAIKRIKSALGNNENDFVIFDIYDSVVGSAYFGIEFPNECMAFRAHSLGEKISREDVQISFTEKLPKAYTSFGMIPNVTCLGDYIFYPTQGSFLSVNNSGMTLNMVGTEFTSENINNYAHKRITLKLTFVPIGKKLYSNSKEYENFKNVIEYAENGSMNDPMKHMLKLGFKLSSIEFTVRGTEENETVDTFGELILSALEREFGFDLHQAILADAIDISHKTNGENKDDFKVIVFDTDKMTEVHLRPIYN